MSGIKLTETGQEVITLDRLVQVGIGALFEFIATPDPSDADTISAYFPNTASPGKGELINDAAGNPIGARNRDLLLPVIEGIENSITDLLRADFAKKIATVPPTQRTISLRALTSPIFEIEA